ncbi:hypothetical protein AGABI2DRAFT_121919 [Agaricus bisporus var. bisporus H97]|uniref:hypothetical protein n=1 Tax=Agaricus bisporus var. bisporus (strain H97 / ATCC MYA-4626 / FGSC 10389) TaxID=936046 RepID=UPI00029F7216|nr:hypothetical protein AGABI2DRAFT_121919 [Agaricus bisporus var. bisporus H97]EKV43026.1 hypothetical protein AGABI2DRAFT_121919 [Agaricus bisporus var. bisporus H97]
MDRAGSSIPSRLIATIFTQSVLYGAFFVVFLLTYWALVFRSSPGPHPKKSLFFLSSMFILATLHIISSTANALEANLESLQQVLPIFGKAICLLQILVGDSIGVHIYLFLLSNDNPTALGQIYRCWIVLGRRRLFVALPLLLFLGNIAAGIGFLINHANFVQGSMFNTRLWTLTFFSLSLAISMICTLIIALRIWFLSSSKGDQRISSITPMILESGALYSIILIILLLLLATKSWFQYVLIEALPSIIGILFSILLIRIGLGLSIDGPQPSPSPSWSPSHTQFHYSKSSNPPKYLNNNPINPSSPNTHPSHRPFILPLILNQNHNLKEKGQIQIDKAREQQQQQHYNLRSQLPQPSSYFRTSEDIEIDMELEFEIDEARCRRPKSLPINPPSKIYTVPL